MKKSNLTRVEKYAEQVGVIADAIEAVRNEEQDVYDNRSESWQESEAGEALDAEICFLDEATDYLQSAVDALTSIIEG